MLTNVYYYDLYRPYIVSNRETGSYAPKRSRIADRRSSAEPLRQVFVLNKSLKDEIVNYAHNTSYGVNNMRNSARRSASDMEHFNRRIYRDGYDAAQDGLAKDLDAFAQHYNDATQFMQNQQQSPGLRTFSYEIADNLYYNQERLSMLGFSVGENGRLSFDRDFLKSLPPEKINIAIGENIQIFSGLQRHAGDFLTEPLADHMRFKALGYHYNYKLGTMETDGFDMIEAGMLIDKAV